MSKIKRERERLDRIVEKILNDFDREMMDYDRRQGTIARMCLENAKVVARSVSDAAGSQAQRARFERQAAEYDRLVQSKKRTFLSISSSDSSEISSKEIDGLQFCASCEDDSDRVVEIYKRVKLTVEAEDLRQEKGLEFPDVKSHPREWIRKKWRWAKEWIRLKAAAASAGLFFAEEVIETWPYELATSQRVKTFREILEEFNHYRPSTWKAVRSHPLYRDAFLSTVRSFHNIDRIDVDSVEDLEALHAALVVKRPVMSAETLLALALSGQDRDESFRPVIKSWVSLFYLHSLASSGQEKEDLTREMALKVCREAERMCGSALENMIRLGYLEARKDAWEAYVEVPRRRS